MIALLLYYLGLIQRDDERKVCCNGESNLVAEILMATHIEIYYSDQEYNLSDIVGPANQNVCIILCVGNLANENF
jgi:hypothetical protein